MGVKTLSTRQLSSSDVELIKDTIRDELKTHSPDLKAQQDYALGRLKELEFQSQPHDYIRRFVLTIHVLSIHERIGGLRREEVEVLLKLAEAILQHLEITPLRSRLSGLYGDLYLARSQLSRSMGQHWRSLWDYQLAKHYSGAQQPGTEAYQQLVNGLRLFRLGMGATALFYLNKAEAGELEPRLRVLCRIHKIRLLRLTGQKNAAGDLIQKTLSEQADKADSSHSSPTRSELDWELAWLDCIEQQNPTQLVTMALNRKGAHFTASYVFEALLIAYCHESRQWLQRFPKVESLYRHNRIKISSRDILYRSCQTMEYLYEPGIATGQKLEKLGVLLDQLDEFKNIDKVLIVYLAGIRWLIRSNQYLLAKALLQRYRTLSLSLSDNNCNDALGLSGNLETRDWHQQFSMKEESK